MYVRNVSAPKVVLTDVLQFLLKSKNIYTCYVICMKEYNVKYMPSIIINESGSYTCTLGEESAYARVYL